MSGNTKRRTIGPFPHHLPAIGDPEKQYTIIIPDQNNRSNSTTYTCTRILLAAPIYFRNVECVIDHHAIANKHDIGPDRAAGFFMINDSVFHVNNYDKPISQWEDWVPKYSEFCTAFFLLQLRSSTQFIFEDSR